VSELKSDRAITDPLVFGNRSKTAALVAAVRTQGASIVERLIAADAEAVKRRDAAGSTLLHHAAGFGTIDTVKVLLDAGTEVNAANPWRSMPLHRACMTRRRFGCCCPTAPR
jgi:ankyrin repeat protein